MLSQGRDKEPLSPYCDGKDFKNERTGCVNGRTGVGPCLIRNYTIPLPQEYQVRQYALFTINFTPPPSHSTCLDGEGVLRFWLTIVHCMG